MIALPFKIYICLLHSEPFLFSPYPLYVYMLKKNLVDEHERRADVSRFWAKKNIIPYNW